MNLIFLGPPGAGKGTQAQRVCQALNIPQISTGDILRRAIADKTTTGLEAKSYIDAGKLVPDEVVIAIVKERLSQPDCANGYILDGFPRTVPQAEALKGIAKIDAVINLEVPDHHLVKRLSGRRVCLKCGGTYHVDFMKENTNVCSACNEELIQREDDKEETVQSRLNVYHDQTAPLVSFYEKEGLLRTINGAQDMDTIFGEIMKALGVNP